MAYGQSIITASLRALSLSPFLRLYSIFIRSPDASLEMQRRAYCSDSIPLPAHTAPLSCYPMRIAMCSLLMTDTPQFAMTQNTPMPTPG